MKQIKMDLTSLSEALGDVEKEFNVKEKVKYDIVKTSHTCCPECGGALKSECRSADKGLMTIYGRNGVKQVLHIESRCQERHCRFIVKYQNMLLVIGVSVLG